VHRNLIFGRFIRTATVNPSKNGYYYWSLVITTAYLYNMMLVIARFTFDDLQDSYRDIWLVLDYISDAVYILDTIVEARKGWHLSA